MIVFLATLVGGFSVVPTADALKQVPPPKLELVAGGYVERAIAMHGDNVYVAESGRVFEIAKDGSWSMCIAYVWGGLLDMTVDDAGLYVATRLRGESGLALYDRNLMRTKKGPPEILTRGPGWPSPVVLDGPWAYIGFTSEDRIEIHRVHTKTKAVEILHRGERERQTMIRQIQLVDGRLWWLERDSTHTRIFALDVGGKPTSIRTWQSGDEKDLPRAFGHARGRLYVAKSTGLYALTDEGEEWVVFNRPAAVVGLATNGDDIYWAGEGFWHVDLAARTKTRIAGAAKRQLGPIVDATHVYWLNDGALWRVAR